MDHAMDKTLHNEADSGKQLRPGAVPFLPALEAPDREPS